MTPLMSAAPHEHSWTRWRTALSPTYHRPRHECYELRWPIRSYRTCAVEDCPQLEWSSEAAMQLNYRVKIGVAA